MGAGEGDLRLRDLDLTNLAVNMGAGRVEVDFTGDRKKDLLADIEGGVGQAVIRLPRKIGVVVHASGGIGTIDASGLKHDGDQYTNDAYGKSPVTIHLKGVGWTEYDNIYVATYDNAYMGYACGFNSHGDVVINFTATGEPGAHVIDLYPGIYQGPPTEPQQLYRLPQLTYADDHPGNKIPAIRVTFEITPLPTGHISTSSIRD